MNGIEFLYHGLIEAFELIIHPNAYIISITEVSLKVSGIATLLATITAIPLAFLLAFYDFKGSSKLTLLINTGMGLPPVFVGLFLFVLLVPVGPLGFMNLIYTQKAMILAQYILVTPIITGISLSAFKSIPGSVIETVYTLGGKNEDVVFITLNEAKYGVITAILAGLGRALSEVGAILIVGGNIAESGSINTMGAGESVTRTLTTAITSETSKANMSTALALGIILIILYLIINIIANFIQSEDKPG